MLLEYPSSPVRAECTCCASCTKAKGFTSTSPLPKVMETFSLKRAYEPDTSMPRVSKTKIFKPNIAPDFTLVSNSNNSNRINSSFASARDRNLERNQRAVAYYESTQNEQKNKRVKADSLLKGYQALEKSYDLLAESNRNNAKSIRYRSSPPPLSSDPVIEKYSTRYFVDRNRIEKIEEPTWNSRHQRPASSSSYYKTTSNIPSPTPSVNFNRNTMSPSNTRQHQHINTTKNLTTPTTFSLLNNNIDSSFVYPQIDRVLSISPGSMGSSLPPSPNPVGRNMESMDTVKRMGLNACKSNSLDSMSSFSGSDEEETATTTTTTEMSIKTPPPSVTLINRKTHETRVGELHFMISIIPSPYLY